MRFFIIHAIHSHVITSLAVLPYAWPYCTGNTALHSILGEMLGIHFL